MNFCLIEEESDHHKYILAMLISINQIYHNNYNVVIGCSEETKKYILNFPYEFEGQINWLILENIDENNIRYFKNILLTIENGIDLFGEVTYLDTRLDMINKLTIPTEIKNQGIGYVSRNVGYRDEDMYQKYIFSVLYINDKKYLHEMNRMLCENISEWQDYSHDKYSLDELRSLNKKFVKYIIELPFMLAFELNIDKFLSHETVVSTEDFFALHDRLKLSDIKKWKISKKLIDNKKEQNLDHNNNKMPKILEENETEENETEVNKTKVEQETIDGGGKRRSTKKKRFR